MWLRIGKKDIQYPISFVIYKEYRVYEKEFEKWQINAQQNSLNVHKVANCTHSSSSYEINLRCMLAAYHLGTGSQDVTKSVA